MVVITGNVHHYFIVRWANLNLKATIARYIRLIIFEIYSAVMDADIQFIYDTHIRRYVMLCA